jgi:hypothetical protein
LQLAARFKIKSYANNHSLWYYGFASIVRLLEDRISKYAGCPSRRNCVLVIGTLTPMRNILRQKLIRMRLLGKVIFDSNKIKPAGLRQRALLFISIAMRL